MKELLQRAIDTAHKRGASYSDARYVERETQTLLIKNGEVGLASSETSRGVGVRVVVNGAWGFSSSSNLTFANMDFAASRAVSLAKASSSVMNEPVDLGDPVKIAGTYQTPIAQDPFSVSIPDKIELLLKADFEMRKVKGVVVTEAASEIIRTKKIFTSSEGSCIEQTLYATGCGIGATAVGRDEVQNRSYPNSVGRHMGTEGWEFVERHDLPGHAQGIAEESIALLTAKTCPSGYRTLILDGSQTARQIHESCGHSVEFDRVRGAETASSGTSFLTLEKLGEFEYGSDLVNVSADATIPGGLGTFGFDDEGIPAQRSELVKDGRFVGYLTSRETATKLGQYSNGSARASNWNRLPLIRMTNVNLEPGSWSLDDLIADTDDGIYMQTNRSSSIDEKRLNFQFGTEIAWEIKNGKLGQMLKNPIYAGVTPGFWRNCDAICGGKDWIVWGIPNCGKGQPEQICRVGHGAAPTRFRNVKVGLML